MKQVIPLKVEKMNTKEVRMANTKDSALAQHVYNNNHSIDWDNCKIIGKEIIS